MALSTKYDFRRVESEILPAWKKEKVADRTIGYREDRPLYAFLEGPPTANAPPALHHVEMRTFKDLFCRFKYMQGFAVPRKGGWDCHGLPVEVQVEKKLGLKSKKEVLGYGIGKFNNLCRDDVFTFINDWEKLTERMAFWIDLKNPYVTLDNKYIESVWWSLKQLYDKKLLYESHKVVPFCPRCETPLSSHEVALGYNEVSDPSITTSFKLKSVRNKTLQHDRFLLAWTTTPWTTPANVALAVGKGMTYVVVESAGKQYVLGKDAVSRYFDEPKIIEEIKGEDLIGAEYEPLFSYFVGKLDKPAWMVVAADFVSAEEGTGIVHQAPAFGEDDYNTCKREDLAFIQPIGEDGKFTSEVPDFEGMFFKKADAAVVEMLEKEHKLFRSEKYRHSYPFCWRCDTPLMYYAINSWFVRVTAYQDELLRNNAKINWYPEHIKDGRFGDWLRNVKDWALSRKKFWGSPLPIWRCPKCDNTVAIGSIKELRERASSEINDIDLHKPAIDEVKLTCQCGGEMSRVPDVIDCWYDSGAASFAQFHYPFENQERFKKTFPYAFIAEAIDQTRGWFYTLHVLGTLLFGSPAYQNVVCAGHVIDEKGEKMSKSKGNIIDPGLAFDTFGVDAVRLQFCTSAPGGPKRFGMEAVRDTTIPFFTTIWNVANFSKDHMSPGALTKPGRLQKEDLWLKAKVATLVRDVTASMEHHDYHLAVGSLREFLDAEVSKWYIKVVRDRTLEDDPAVKHTLSHAFHVTLRLMAPFTPYISDFLWREFKFGEESIHVASWPKPESIDPVIQEEMNVAKDITQQMLAVRDKIQRGVRWPLREAVIVTKHPGTRDAVRSFGNLIRGQVNIKKITVVENFPKAKINVTLNRDKIREDFGERADQVEAAAQAPMVHYEKIEQTGMYKVQTDDGEKQLGFEHFIVTSEHPKKYEFDSFRSGRLYIDIESNPELEAEGYSREFVRRAQQFRKNMGLKRTDVITIRARVPQKLRGILFKFSASIKSRVGAKALELSEDEPKGDFDTREKMRIKEHTIEFFARK